MNNQTNRATELTHLHVLVFPFPIQGHINPMLQFAKRLLSKGLTVTILTTSSTHNLIKLNLNSIPKSLHIQTINDGLNPGQKPAATTQDINQFSDVVSQSLADFFRRNLASNTSLPTPKFLVYDCFMPWALALARDSGIDAAPFFTQSCAVKMIYYHLRHGTYKLPLSPTPLSLPAMPPLENCDLPSFISNPTSFPAFFKLVMDQYSNFSRAKCFLSNSFSSLEEEVVTEQSNSFSLSRELNRVIFSLFTLFFNSIAMSVNLLSRYLLNMF